MNATEFEKRARNPTLDREQLETLKANALAKGNREFADIANQVLLERFSAPARRSGGATPTTASFRGKDEDFPSGKEAYLWLVERFRNQHLGLLESQQAWHQRAFKGAKRRYFALSAAELFPEGSSQATEASNFHPLVAGWYANVNLNHGQKFEILLRLAAICQLSYPEDRDFRVTGATVELAEKQEAVLVARKLLEELRNL